MFSFFRRQKSRDFESEKEQEKVKEKPKDVVSTPAVKKKEDPDKEKEKRNLLNQEARFQEKLTELSNQLTARNDEATKLRYEMEVLKRDVLVKSSGMDRLQAELNAAYKEIDSARHTLRKLQDELQVAKQQGMEVTEELTQKTEEMKSLESSTAEKLQELEQSLKDREEKLKELETRMKTLEEERDQLLKERADMEAEREEEIKIVHEALEEALAEKQKIQTRFERDFEKLRTVNTDREQQLLDDFEWKLREVEKTCKRKLEEKEKQAEEKLKDSRKAAEQMLKKAEEQLKEVEHLKSYEAEVNQLRGLTNEQQRSLRVANRQNDQFQVNERVLKEEVSKLRSLLEKEKKHMLTIQGIHDKQLSEKDRNLQTRLDHQKNEINAQWEDRLRQECSRLKSELDQLHSEEKHLAVESMKLQKEQELRTAKQNWERRMEDSLKEISKLKDSLTAKDAYYQKELEEAQTNTDREVFELRRKMDKMDMSYQDQIDDMVNKHHKEIEKLNEEHEKRLLQMEQNWQLQMSSTRATLELVKEQMERDSQDRLEALETKHRSQLEHQWNQLVEDKENALEDLEIRHRQQMEKLREEVDGIKKARSTKETELLHVIEKLNKQLSGQNVEIGDLKGNMVKLEGGMEDLSRELDTKSQEVEKVQTESNQRLRECEAACNRQVEELKRQHESERLAWEVARDEMEKKIASLDMLLVEAYAKYENRPSREDDVKLIEDLQQVIAEKDKEVSNLTEEKRFFQLELINKETNYNKFFNSQPVIGVIDPLQYKKKTKLAKSASPLKRISNSPAPPLPPKPKTQFLLSSQSVPLPDRKLLSNLHVRSQTVVPVLRNNANEKTSPPSLDVSLEPEPDPSPPQ